MHGNLELGLAGNLHQCPHAQPMAGVEFDHFPEIESITYLYVTGCRPQRFKPGPPTKRSSQPRTCHNGSSIG